MKIRIITATVILLNLCLFVIACQYDSAKPSEEVIDANAATYDLIQKHIFDKSCATSDCHAAASDASFKQHGLVLSTGNAWVNLVGVLAKNPDARAEGLKLVDIQHPDSSFLLHKLHGDTGHHGGKLYGAIMPLGADPLSEGQVEFIEAWIAAGAPKSGIVADVNLLKNNTPQNETWVAPPYLAKQLGYQMRIPKFRVDPNTNREFFIRQDVGNTEPIYITSFETFMRPGSHHLLVYGFKDNKNLPEVGRLRDIRYYDKSGARYSNIFSQMALSQYIMLSPGGTNFKYNLPPGYGLEIEANASFDLNAHYFNLTNQTRYGEVVVNMYTKPRSQIQKVCKPLDLYNFDIVIPAKSRKIEQKDFLFKSDVEIVSLTSHAHARMEKFEIQIVGGARNGETVLTETDWQHPKVIDFAKPIQLKKGEGLRSVVTFNNTTDRELRFGLTTDDEMNIIFGYYVKK
jgi:hypothetical protein